MPVALYVRVSTEEQRERQSISTQRDFAERYCSLHQLSLVTVYADDGVSGTVPLPNRPMGGRILLDARLRRFDQLLVYKLDRLGRETRLILDTVAELEQCGVRIKSLTEEFDTATASGRLMLTLLSGFAAHEREIIRERSLAGSQRLAHSGAWMGGSLPYGYRAEHRQGGGLVIAEEPVSPSGISEAEVIRNIFRWSALEHQSCRRIADRLNELGVPGASRPCGSTATDTRRARWRAGRVRNLLVSTTYKGQHWYGKRSRIPGRELIQRTVPAIVTEELWQQAQQTLLHNLRFGPRHCRRAYLLRGLVKCGLCGLTYIGTTIRSRSGRQDAYYRCNGRHDTKGVWGEEGKRCAGRDVKAEWLERTVWDQIEMMLRYPQRVIKRLRRQLDQQRRRQEGTRTRLAGLEHALEEKSQERDRVLGLFRKGRIGEGSAEQQLREIEDEEAVLHGQIADLSLWLQAVDTEAAQIAATTETLERLGARLQPSISWESRRELVEYLVKQARVDTRGNGRDRVTTITITFRVAENRPAIRPVQARRKQGPPNVGRTEVTDHAPTFGISMRYNASRHGQPPVFSHGGTA